MSSPRRRAVLAASTAAAPLLLVACGAGSNALTNQPYAPGDGVQTVSADGCIRVLNALVVADDEPGGPGVVTVGLVDMSAEGDRLLQVRAETEEGDVEALIVGDTEILPRGTLLAGGETSTTGIVFEEFPGIAGQVAPLVFRFENAGEVLSNGIVYPPEGLYEGIYAAPLPDDGPLPTPPATIVPTPVAPAAGVDDPNTGDPTPVPTETGENEADDELTDVVELGEDDGPPQTC